MIAFSGNSLNRLSEKRPDTAWIAARLRDPASLILPVWRLQPFTIGADAALEAGFLRPGLCESLAARDAPCVFLGSEGERAMFALDISAAEDPHHTGPLAGLGEFRELRGAAALLPAKDLAILGQAKAMIDWHQRHGFCARCGAPTAPGDAGYKRVCAACGTEHFPRTDPAVIMLATEGDACLLGRNKNWPPDFYSALAGFLEPGESIEEAVRRELFEEAGVRAGKIAYYASQPWPFPSQLMIGCFAECDSRALTLDPNEIADAQWFTREQARALLAGEIPGRRGPFAVAIAHHLIRAWAEGL
ncbi:MAG: NAD(+) diphosphatase [Alphaproteobacteria bacterium]|nr:NAD(+) diphosphatase [Alphaproteobacteria bacterium]MDE2111310.1 NAD(+) diphosphatase [Alphaproteobacteria bacterium]MDE2495886.1 NAD(+) diphosphatase [Alphaproteobacteria bacterium]